MTELEKPKKKKWLPIVLALLLLVASAATVWYFFLRSDEAAEEKTEQFSAKAAIEDCVGQLRALTADAENLHAVIDAAVAQYKTGGLSISASRSGMEETISELTFKIHARKNSKVFSGDVRLGITVGDNEATFDLNLAFTEEMLQIAAPALIDDVLQINMTEQGLGAEEDLTAITKLEELIAGEDFAQLFKDLIASIEAKDPVEEKILFGQEERDCTVYAISFDEAIASRFVQIVETAMEEAGAEMDATDPADLDLGRLIVCDGKIVGVIMESEQESIGEIRLLLCGKDNPWSDISLSVGGKEKLSVKTEVTDTGFETRITAVEKAKEISIICDDEDQVLRMIDRETGKELSLRYGMEYESVFVSLEKGHSSRRPRR